jgi:hypothetical protein
MKSKLFVISNKLLNQSLDSTKYTPMRGNQLSIALLMNDYDNFLPDKQQFLNDFIQKFWTTCKCPKACYSKVSFNDSLKLYETYASMLPNEKALKLGAIIQNFTTESESNRNLGIRAVYNYQIAGSIVCRKLFQMIFSISKSQIERLQECIKNKRGFQIKKKGNNCLSEEM